MLLRLGRMKSLILSRRRALTSLGLARIDGASESEKRTRFADTSEGVSGSSLISRSASQLTACSTIAFARVGVSGLLGGVKACYKNTSQ